jgi:hypothetical protein
MFAIVALKGVSSMEYKVVPFIGQSRGSLSAADVAKQLELILNQHVANGWEFCQLSDVNVEVQPGCVAGLLGAKVQYVRFDQVIFRNSANAAISLQPDAAWMPLGPELTSPTVEQAPKDSDSGAASVSTPALAQIVAQRCPHCGGPEGSHDILCIESMRT